MATLDRNLRRQLERTVRAARRAAEDGARTALGSLAVGDARPYPSLSAAQRALRNRLRARGRQLGDRRGAQTGAQEVARLAGECAYEYWHRMLFARFLAEAGLLYAADHGVTVTLDEVRELARAENSDWAALASAYAQRMLPRIFRGDDPVLALAPPAETRVALEDLLNALPRETFLADDSLGWVYQFWQADRKAEVNESGVKIGAGELPAVTQLFTEDYMVLFLLHNTLGAWWAGKLLAARPELAGAAADEAELRAACAVGGVEWTYLRFVRGADGAGGPWRPAAGAFEGWPRAAKDLTVLDPCMGSGHFLVFALPILAAFRMAEEGLTREAAVDAALRDNLFGLEIDPRCTQIAAFNLAFAAWRMAGYRPLPPLNLACSGIAIGVTKDEWLRLAARAADAGLDERERNALAALHDLFAEAPLLGSLIDPLRRGGDVFTEEFAKLAPVLDRMLTRRGNDEAVEMAVAAQGMARAAMLLARRFTLVATNVPFLGRTKQNRLLRDRSTGLCRSAQRDLATVMLRRLLDLANENGGVAAVTPQNWLFLESYAEFRKYILRSTKLCAVAVIGAGGFDSSAATGAFVSLVTIARERPDRRHSFTGIDAGAGANTAGKARILASRAASLCRQATQTDNPDCRITLSGTASGPLLRQYAQSYQGISPADLPKFGRRFWECIDTTEFRFWQSSVKATTPFSGRSLVLWSGERLQEAVKLGQAYIRGAQAHGKPGVSISQMGDLPATLSTGESFDTNGAAIVPRDPADLPAIWAFCSSPEYNDAVREIDWKLNVTGATLVKVPFDAAHWRRVAAERYPNGLPKPSSNDPTQWLFAGHPAGSEAPLQVAVARLAGYRWPRQTGSGFMNCPALAPDGLEAHADADGIVCLAALRGEAPAHERLAALLADSFGAAWDAAKLADMLAAAGFGGKTLADWLRDGFFRQHCALFKHRPFVWHIWDGRRDGFHALVNYHRLAAPNGEGRRTLEKLVYSCLGDWIERQRAELAAETAGAEARLAHAEHLRDALAAILEGEPPFDIFVRWKPLREQPIGWEPDPNDGVRANIRPFMAARPFGARGKTACILRARPNIKWARDRGREPPRGRAGYPWFWSRAPADTLDFRGGAEYDGARWNDLHYTRAFKTAAREHAAEDAHR